MPRLTPVEKPRTLFQRIAFWQTKREYGKVLTPLKVIYARKPRLAFVAQHISWTMEKGISLDAGLRFLVGVQVSRLNGCTFCQDLNLARAVRDRMGGDKFVGLDDFESGGNFTDRERAALAFCTEATRDRRVSDSTFARLREHFDEVEIVELTWVNAVENYFNLQAAILGIGSDDLAALHSPSADKPGA